MRPSRQTLFCVFSLLVSMLQCFYVAFYCDVFARQHLSSRSLSPAAELAARAAEALTVEPAKAGRQPRRGTRGSVRVAVPALPESHGPWTALALLAMGQAVYTTWKGLRDVGVDCGADSPLRAATRRRLSRLSVVGPAWALCFALMWQPLRLPLVHPALAFTLCMALHEGLLTLCTSAAQRLLLWEVHAAVLSASEREGLHARVAAFSAVGGVGAAFAAVLVEDGPALTLRGFRWLMLGCGVAAGLGFFVVATLARARDEGRASTSAHAASGPTRAGGMPQLLSPPIGEGSGDDYIPSPRRGEALSIGSFFFDSASRPATSSQRFMSFAGQTLGRSSMKAVLWVWALQEFSFTVVANFFSLLLTIVCGHTMAPSVRACALLVSVTAPHALTAALPSLFLTVGKKKVLAGLLVARLCVGAAFILLAVAVLRGAAEAAGPSQPVADKRAATGGSSGAVLAHSTASFLFATLLVLSRVLVEAVRGMQGAILRDVCDEDTITFGRARPMTTAIHALAEVAGKPAQTAALLLTCTLLVAGGLLPHSVFAGEGVATGKAALVMCFVGCHGVVTGGAMLLVWRRQYTLDGKHLQFIQMAMRKRSEDEGVEQV